MPQQLAIYIGWLMHRIWGGIVAGAFFVIPSIIILLGLSYIYAAYGNIPLVLGVLAGFKPVVVAIVVVKYPKLVVGVLVFGRQLGVQNSRKRYQW